MCLPGVRWRSENAISERLVDSRTREQLSHRHREMRRAESLGDSTQEKGCSHQIQPVLDISALCLLFTGRAGDGGGKHLCLWLSEHMR